MTIDTAPGSVTAPDALELEVDQLRAEVEKLKGLKPEFGPFPPEGAGLPRYGLRWSGPQQPLAVPMVDGYWVPAHLAGAAVLVEREACAALAEVEAGWDAVDWTNQNAAKGRHFAGKAIAAAIRARGQR